MAEGLALEEGIAALKEIGDITTLGVLLTREDKEGFLQKPGLSSRPPVGSASVRSSARSALSAPSTSVTRALASIGDEAAIPVLAEVLEDKSLSKDARAAIETALDQLEATPPPALHIQLMGEFEAKRGAKPIPEKE